MVAGTVGAVVGAVAAMGGNAVGNLTHRDPPPPPPIVQQASPSVRPNFTTPISSRIDPNLTSAPVSVSTPNTTSQGGNAGGATVTGVSPSVGPFYIINSGDQATVLTGDAIQAVKHKSNASQKTSSTLHNTNDQCASLPINVRQRRTEKTEQLTPPLLPTEQPKGTFLTRVSPLEYIAAATTLLVTAALIATKKLSAISSSLKHAPLSCLALPITTRDAQKNRKELIATLQEAVGPFDTPQELHEYVDQEIEQENTQLSGYLHFVAWGYYMPLVSSVEVQNLENDIRERLANLAHLAQLMQGITLDKE